MNAQQLIKEYQHLDIQERHVFLSDICEIEHLKISQSGDTTRLINEQDTLSNKTADLKSFFKPFQKDISNFCFDREEANAR